MTWIPPRNDQHHAKSVNFKLASGGGAVALQESLMLTVLPSYQYFFVVLAPSGRYEYIDKRLDCIKLRRLKGDSGPEPPQFYSVVTMLPTRRPALPTAALCWTSIAYLLWDDSDPALWDLEQQQALIDWLHWGGQIIVSGPDALVQLQSSFLRPYLPATVEKSRKFSQTDLDELNTWAGSHGQGPEARKKWEGAVLKKEPGADDVPYTGENLVVERRVGRGRIVVTAFRIAGDEFLKWPGCDCFFNACLMRRGPREFSISSMTSERTVRWFDPSGAKKSNATTPARTFDSHTGSPLPAVDTPNEQTLANAEKNTNLRYFSRDAGLTFHDFAQDVEAARSGATPYESDDPNAAMPDVEMGVNSFPSVGSSLCSPGLGAWNDYSPVADVARSALHDASGIIVPERSFIVWVIVGYLCVLVPANWLVFRLMGRVEWAWIAAPLIAVGCTAVVIHQAQLNIGFIRSRNAIAVVEMQPGYSRAHMTRYTSLYTSLSTNFEYRIDDPGAQILPFPGSPKSSKFQMAFGESPGAESTCRRAATRTGVRLRPPLQHHGLHA